VVLSASDAIQTNGRIDLTEGTPTLEKEEIWCRNGTEQMAGLKIRDLQLQFFHSEVHQLDRGRKLSLAYTPRSLGLRDAQSIARFKNSASSVLKIPVRLDMHIHPCRRTTSWTPASSPLPYEGSSA
jgi:hypothetical protein